MKNTIYTLGAAAMAASTLFPVALLANNKDAETTIEEIVVTATRLPEQVSDVLGEVEVVTSDDIVASGALDLADVLARQNGLTVVRAGGVGAQTSVFMRGSESDHTLLLVNGVRYNSASDGAAPWADIPLHNIERIEIVRGARSSLYGSDALGGVIHIITREVEGGEVSFSMGSYGMREAGFNATARGDRVSLTINANNARASGIDATNENTEPRRVDNDGYSRRSVGARLVAGIGSTDLEIDWQQTRNVQEIDDFGSTEQTTDIDGLSVRLGQSNGGVDWKFLLGTSQQDFSNFSGQRDIAEVQLSYHTSYIDYLIAFGHEETEGEQQLGYSEKFDSTFVLAQLGAELHDFATIASLRSDDYSGFGRHTTGNLSVGYQLTENADVTVSYGTGFRAPSLNDLFAAGFANDINFDGNVDAPEDTNNDGQFDQAFAGNPDLKPEESEEFSVSLRYQIDHHAFSVSAFDIQIENLIAFGGTQGNFIFQAANQAVAESKGLEFSWSADWQKYSAGVSATIQRTKDDQGRQQLRRPDESATAFVRYVTDRLGSYGIDVIANSGHSDFLNKSPFSRINTSGYAVFNLSGQWALGNGKLTAKLENIFDKDYEQAVGFSTPGFGGYLNYRITW